MDNPVFGSLGRFFSGGQPVPAPQLQPPQPPPNGGNPRSLRTGASPPRPQIFAYSTRDDEEDDDSDAPHAVLAGNLKSLVNGGVLLSSPHPTSLIRDTEHQVLLACRLSTRLQECARQLRRDGGGLLHPRLGPEARERLCQELKQYLGESQDIVGDLHDYIRTLNAMHPRLSPAERSACGRLTDEFQALTRQISEVAAEARDLLQQPPDHFGGADPAGGRGAGVDDLDPDSRPLPHHYPRPPASSAHFLSSGASDRASVATVSTSRSAATTASASASSAALRGFLGVSSTASVSMEEASSSAAEEDEDEDDDADGDADEALHQPSFGHRRRSPARPSQARLSNPRPPPADPHDLIYSPARPPATPKQQRRQKQPSPGAPGSRGHLKPQLGVRRQPRSQASARGRLHFRQDPRFAQSLAQQGAAEASAEPEFELDFDGDRATGVGGGEDGARPPDQLLNVLRQAETAGYHGPPPGIGDNHSPRPPASRHSASRQHGTQQQLRQPEYPLPPKQQQLPLLQQQQQMLVLQAEQEQPPTLSLQERNRDIAEVFLLSRRQQQLTDIEHDVGLIGAVFGELADLVHAQGHQLDLVEQGVQPAKADAREAARSLREAHRLHARIRMRRLFLVGWLVFSVVLLGGLWLLAGSIDSAFGGGAGGGLAAPIIAADPAGVPGNGHGQVPVGIPPETVIEVAGRSSQSGGQSVVPPADREWPAVSQEMAPGSPASPARPGESPAEASAAHEPLPAAAAVDLLLAPPHTAILEIGASSVLRPSARSLADIGEPVRKQAKVPGTRDWASSKPPQ